MQIPVLNVSGQKVGEETLPAHLLVPEVNVHLIWEAIKAELANARQGTHKTKTKGEVRGGGIKPWRQKGTGRARQGSIRNPHWRHGGVVFGPIPRDYSEDFPKKKKLLAYKHILTAKAQESEMVILNELPWTEPSTKKAFADLVVVVDNSPFAVAYKEGRKIRPYQNRNRRNITFVYADSELSVKLSLRNIPWVKLLGVERLAAHPLLYNHGVIFSRAAYQRLVEKFAN